MIVKDGLKPIICGQASSSAVNPFLKQTQYISFCCDDDYVPWTYEIRGIWGPL